jgi:hypothetical protein
VVWTKGRDLPRNDCKQCDANTHDRPLNHVIQVHTCSLLHSTRHRDTWYQTPPHECTTGVSGVFPGRSGVVRSFRNIFRNHRSGTEIMKGTHNKIITHNKVQGYGSPQNHVVQVHTCSLLRSTRHRDTIVFRSHHMSTRPECPEFLGSFRDQQQNHIIQVHTCSLLRSTRHRDTL